MEDRKQKINKYLKVIKKRLPYFQFLKESFSPREDFWWSLSQIIEGKGLDSTFLSQLELESDYLGIFYNKETLEGKEVPFEQILNDQTNFKMIAFPVLGYYSRSSFLKHYNYKCIERSFNHPSPISIYFHHDDFLKVFGKMEKKNLEKKEICHLLAKSSSLSLSFAIIDTSERKEKKREKYIHMLENLLYNSKSIILVIDGVLSSTKTLQHFLNNCAVLEDKLDCTYWYDPNDEDSINGN